MAVDYRTNPAVFNKEVVICKEVIVIDEYGEPNSRWHPIRKVMASIEPMSGREYFQAMQAQAEGTVRIVIRYSSGVTDRSRLLYKGIEGDVWYEVKAPPINPLEANRYLELMCARLYTGSEVFSNSAQSATPEVPDDNGGLLP